MNNKRRISIFVSALVMIISIFALSSCAPTNTVTVTGTRVNEAGEVIITYSDGTEANIGIVGAGNSTNYTINTGDGGIAHAASRGIASAVSVSAKFKINAYGGFFGNTTTTGESRGSGVIYKLDKNTGSAFIITNYHVVYNSYSKTANGISDNINVFVYGSEADAYAIPAKFIGGSMYYDIAVLYVDSSELLKRGSVSAVTVCPIKDASVGETAIAVGNPEGAGISTTLGVVSVDSEQILMNFLGGSGTVSVRVMRVDTAINSGNSGGGLYNSRGELIGIVNAKISDTSVENIGYAIPASIAIPVAENIIDNCHEKENERLLRPMLGITLGSTNAGSIISEETGLITKIESVVISQVSYGALAGDKLAVGDIVTSIKIGDEEMAITRTYHVIDMMLHARLGDTVDINILRAGEAKTVTIEITQDALTEY